MKKQRKAQDMANPSLLQKWVLSSGWAKWETFCLITLQEAGLQSRAGFGSSSRKGFGGRRRSFVAEVTRKL